MSDPTVPDRAAAGAHADAGVTVTPESQAAACLTAQCISLKSVREDALRPFGDAPYEELRATCRRLQYERVQAEGPLLDVLAGFCFQQALRYAASCCQTAQRARFPRSSSGMLTARHSTRAGVLSTLVVEGCKYNW